MSRRRVPPRRDFFVGTDMQIREISKRIRTAKDALVCDGDGREGCRCTIPVGAKYMELVRQFGNDKCHFTYCDSCMQRYCADIEPKPKPRPLPASARTKALALVDECLDIATSAPLFGKLTALREILA